MNNLELKVPPVALVLLWAALMGAAWWVAPGFTYPLPGRIPIAGALALLGVIVCLLGVASFKRARTTVNPMKPESSSSLVISGIYRRTRNPMYLGFLLILLGWAAFLSNPLAVAGIPLFAIYLTWFQIKPEERALESRFGEAFVDYRKRIRRWI